MAPCTRSALRDSQKKEAELPAVELPVGAMDGETKARLLEARRHIPRYLFRAWNNTKSDHTSGGMVGLNTADAIVPRAFCTGRGHSSIYDLKRNELADMVDKHIHKSKGTFQTELSSWAASLSVAMGVARLFLNAEDEDCYISIIDTKGLWTHNQIFFVPDLAFLGLNVYHNNLEYIAHGVIRGPFHRACGIEVFHSTLIKGYNFPPIIHFPNDYFKMRAVSINESMVKEARKIGEHYGSRFTLPMTLALISVSKCRPSLFNQGDEELKTVLRLITTLEVPKGWINDSAIMQDVVFTDDGERVSYPDLR